jgi:hypothetical protein
VAKLEALGFAWHAPPHGGIRNDVGWEAQLAKLNDYKAEHGDCIVPRDWAEDRQLGIWVHNQRANKKHLDCSEPSKGMTAVRAAKLEALGFAWHAPPHGGIRNDVGWEAQLAKLKAYKAEHGDCNVPNRWAADPHLGSWVSCQRKYKKKLDHGEDKKGMTASRVAKLEALGFAWHVAAHVGIRNDAGWEGWLAKLEVYTLQHGDCNVPKDWVENPKLANWVGTQRKYKKKLDRGEPCEGMTVGRAAKLEALGFMWRAPAHGGCSNDAGWEGWLAKLEAYRREHGDCNVPQRWPEDAALGGWVGRPRWYKKRLDRGEPCKGMTAARVAKLEALGPTGLETLRCCLIRPQRCSYQRHGSFSHGRV